ncbi:peroxiredoxin-like family protein [Algiphilus sp. W345]|uniref:Peroxiredoxin-like family protein n=1 Tax=Banduia mediterranea TaxID=3075609 RepID=A0ABU2WFI6_9GAMM|nr:peroxiredoxin-like family protein [Algiphilus sp. W345]MDT0496638.1 peroxiredoxin-like family protein [Algiphilus sp. W345]
MALMAGLVVAATRLWTAPQAWAWWGVVLASGVPMAFFMRLFMGSTARTSANLHGIPMAGGLGTVVALADAGPGLAAGIALFNGVLLSLLYIHSRFSARSGDLLGTGKRLPDLALIDIDGRELRTAELTRKPALWMFYRGNWCPLCMAQIKEVAAEYRRLADRGVEVFLISPQPQDHTRRLAQRFEAPMRFLSDRDNRVAAQLGILARGGLPMGMQALGYDSDVPMPTVFITAAGGRIVYSDLTDNYRLRPEPADFIAALDRAGL